MNKMMIYLSKVNNRARCLLLNNPNRAKKRAKSHQLKNPNKVN